MTNTSNLFLRNVTRRKLLVGAASLSLITAISPMQVIAENKSNTINPNFVSVSKKLTQHNDLNPILIERFYKVLKVLSPTFDNEVNKLAEEISATGHFSQNTKLSPDSKKTAITILSAWYTGIVGEGVNAQVITYRHALEFNAVDDVLGVRSYCISKPGSWAEKPVEEA